MRLLPILMAILLIPTPILAQETHSADGTVTRRGTLTITQQGRNTSIVADGNLEATQRPGCIRVTAVTPSMTPADLALGVADCLIRQDAERAGDLGFLMMIRTAFDSRRVTDRTAHQAGQMLFFELQSALPADIYAPFAPALQARLPGGSNHARLCSEAAALGLPDYFPRYMIQHGMAAFSPRNGDTGLAADFDAQQAMDWALGTYAHCPTAAG